MENNTERLYHAKCTDCGKEFDYTKSETKTTPFIDAETMQPVVYITCPKCGKACNSRNTAPKNTLNDNQPLTYEWLERNVDSKNKELELHFCEMEFGKDENNHQYISITFNGEFHWDLKYSKSECRWHVALDIEPCSDRWMPSIKTIGDFKGLFKVATGMELPIKKQ